MLSISAPSKFVLTLHSVPPFFIESILAFILVILLAIPLIARVQMLLEGPMSYFSLIPLEAYKFDSSNSIIIHDSIITPTPVISLNLQLDTIRPINSSSSVQGNLSNLDLKLIHPNYNVISDLIVNTKNLGIPDDNPLPDPKSHDYDYYRHKFIELNLKRQYGDRVPGNVVLNSHHLNRIDGRMIAKVRGKYKTDLFDFIDYPSLRNNEKIKLNPVHHFQRSISNNDKLVTIEKSIDTLHSNLEIDRVPEMIDFKERAQTPTCQKLRKRKLQSESSDPVRDGSKSTLDKFKKLETTVSPPVDSQLSDKDSRSSKIPDKKLRQHDETSERRGGSLKPLKKKIVKSEVGSFDGVKNEENLGCEKLSIACTSVASSEAFSFNSASSKQKPGIGSRSSCSSAPRGFKNSKARINTRPRSGGYFGWDIPDIPGDDAHSSRPKSSNSLIAKRKLRGFKGKKLPFLENLLDMEADVQLDDNQLLEMKNTGERQVHKSRLPIRKRASSRKERRENSQNHKNSRVFGTTEDTASQVSHTILQCSHSEDKNNSQLKNTGSLIVQNNSSGIDKMKMKKPECNKNLPSDWTITKRNFKATGSMVDTPEDSMKRKEINTSNQVHKMKSLLDESGVNLNYKQEKSS